MAHGYWKDGKFIKTDTKADAVNAWRKEHGYSTGGVYDMGGGRVVDARKKKGSTPATPKIAIPGTPSTQETAAERNARLQAAFTAASASTKTFGSTYVPAPGAPKTSYNPFDTVLGALSTTAKRAADVLNVGGGKYYSPWTTPEKPTASADINQRRYTLPQFGTPSSESGFGLDGTLNRAQLAEAARLTGDAMFTYGKLPSVISSDVANQLPYKPKSDLFKNVMQDAFGVDGFETSDEFLTKLGYYEYEKGKWEIQDPVTVTGYGAGYYQGGGISGGGGGGSASRGYAAGGALVNWRIGL